MTTSATLIVEYLGEDTHAARPATPNIPATGLALYYETDTLSLFFYDLNTTAWIEIPLTGGGGGGLTTTAESSSFSAAADHRYLVDTTSAAVTATMSATPSTNDIVAFADSTGQFATNNLTVAWNGKNFQGSSSSKVLSINYSMLLVQYTGTQWVQIPA